MDLAERRRILVDLGTSADAFGERSDGFDTGLEPAEGEADSGNGGNASPLGSGTPTVEASFEIVCRVGGPCSAPRAESGAQMRVRAAGEAADHWRGFAWERTYRFSWTAEVVYSKAVTGDEIGSAVSATFEELPSGRVVVLMEKHKSGSFVGSFSVEAWYRDPGDDVWTFAEEVEDGDIVRRRPRLILREDNVLVATYFSLNTGGSGYRLTTAYSADSGESWSTLSDTASSHELSTDTDRLDVARANGYFTAVTGDSNAGYVNFFYSLDGGATYRWILSTSGSPAFRLPCILPLLDDSLLVFHARHSGESYADDSVRCTRIAAGLDTPSIGSDYVTVSDDFAADDVEDLVPFRGYDGLPYVAVRDGSSSPPVYRVFRGDLDGTVWTETGADAGMLSIFTLAAAVTPKAGAVYVGALQAGYGVLYVNDGESTSPVSAVEDESLTLAHGSAWENVSVDWPWQFVWTMAAGDPNGAADGMQRTSGAGVGLGTSPSRITITGQLVPAPAYWQATGYAAADRQNVDMTAVACAVYSLSDGSGSLSSDQMVLHVIGSDGVNSRSMTCRLTFSSWRLIDEAGATVASGSRDFGGYVEVLLGVTKGTGGGGELKYALRARSWHSGTGDRAWDVLSVGTHTPASGAGVSGAGNVRMGSIAGLPLLSSGSLIIGCYCLNVGVTSWSSGDGDGLFETGTAAVTRGHVIGAVPVPLWGGLYVSFTGDIAAPGDSYGLSTRYQYRAENLAPGESGVWRSASDASDAWVRVDYGAASGVPRYDLVALAGTNFRTATVRIAGVVSPGPGSYTDIELDAALLVATCSSSPAAVGALTSRAVRVSGAGWEPGQWVGRMFRWETGDLAGTAGRVAFSDEDTVVLEEGVSWVPADAAGADFVLYADRMFVALDAEDSAGRYLRLTVPAQGTPEGYFEGAFLFFGKSYRCPLNWEWETRRTRTRPVEAVESPGGQMTVYDLGEERQELEVEWTGVKHGARAGLVGIWRAAGGGTRVVAVLLDSEGGPDELLPARVVGPVVTTTRALYVESLEDGQPVQEIVDVESMTFREEVK